MPRTEYLPRRAALDMLPSGDTILFYTLAEHGYVVAALDREEMESLIERFGTAVRPDPLLHRMGVRVVVTNEDTNVRYYVLGPTPF